MSDVLPQIGLVFILVLFNAAFAGTELALVSLRDGQLQRLEARGGTGAVLARLAREPNRFLATIQIGITVAGFLASASAAVSLAEPLEAPLGFLGGAAGGASIVVVTIILSYVTLVLGELVPKRIAMQRAERWGLLAARPLSFLSKVTRPAVWLLSRSTDLVVRALGGDPHLQAEDVTQEELRDMVASQSSFSPAQRTIIDGAFEIASRTLHEVLRPRGEVFVLDADDPCATSLDRLAASAHSRAPVAPGANLDATTGVVHLRDLLGGGARPTGDVATPPLVLPEPAGVLESLRRMQLERSQLAVVVNEHGGAEGIITLEDLIEELVGEIYDETDRDVLSVRTEADGALLLPGRFPIHDLTDVGLQLPDGPYATIAGLVLDRLGRLGEVGDTALVDGYRIEVLATTGRAISEVRVHRPERPADHGDDVAGVDAGRPNDRT